MSAQPAFFNGHYLPEVGGGQMGQDKVQGVFGSLGLLSGIQAGFATVGQTSG